MRSRCLPSLLVAVGLLTICAYRLATPHLPPAMATDFVGGVFHGVGIGIELLGLRLLMKQRRRSCICE